MIELKRKDLNNIRKATPKQLNGLHYNYMTRVTKDIARYTDINGNTYKIHLTTLGGEPLMIATLDDKILAENEETGEVVEVWGGIYYTSTSGVIYRTALASYKGKTFIYNNEVNQGTRYRKVSYKEYNKISKMWLKEYKKFNNDMLKDPLETKFYSI